MTHMTISIIIPAYNAERYVDRCLKSVYSDSLSEEKFEVVAINDGSKDNTVELLHAWRDKHKNITLLDKENEGVSVARNAGIEVAKGKYVLFLDVDDELMGGALTKVCNYLEEHEPMDMLVTRQIRNDGKQEKIVDKPPLEEHWSYDGFEAFRKGFIRTNAGGGICRREFLKEHEISFPAGVKNAEDTIFFGHVQVYAKSIVYFNVPLYRINEEKASASRSNDHTKLAKSHITTMWAVADVKKSLKEDREHRAIFDFVVYQLLSNTIADFVKSNDLGYSDFKREVDTSVLLPIDTVNMTMMRNKARLMNISVTLFYFMSWLKNRR